MLDFDVEATAYVFVSVEMAAMLLKKNHNNRPISIKKVRQYVSDIKAERFGRSGDAIAVTKEGFLLNGQHRLLAIVEAGIGAELLIETCADPASMKYRDAGKPRTDGDWLKFRGIPNGRIMSARATVIWILENTSTLSRNTTRSRSEKDEVIDRCRTALDWSISALGVSGCGSLAECAGTLAFCWPVNPSEVDAFARSVRDGVGLDRSSPAYVLREYLITKRRGFSGGRDGRAEAIAATMRAVIAHINREQMYFLKPTLLVESKAFAKAMEFFSSRRKP